MSPLTHGCFVLSLVEISPVVLEKEMKMWKVYRRTDSRTTDNWRSEKLTWAFRSGDFKTSLYFRNFFSIADWFIFLLAIYDSAVPEACIYPPGPLIRKDSWKKLARMKYFRLILIVHFHIYGNLDIFVTNVYWYFIYSFHDLLCQHLIILRSYCNLQCTHNVSQNHIKAHSILLVYLFWIFKTRFCIKNMFPSWSKHIQDNLSYT